MRLDGRLVLITGASSGIGAATARAVARKRGIPVLLARTRPKLDAVAEQIAAAGGQAHVYAVDCGDGEAVAVVARKIEADLGTPDVIVNNAGAGRHLFFEETEPDEFEAMLAAPFYAAVYVTRAFLPGMIERGSGYIVGVNAPIAYAAWQGAAGYAISRWALRGLLEVLRADLRGTGVVVGQVVVGKVASDYWQHNPGSEEALPRLARTTRALTTEEVATTIVRAIEGERRISTKPSLLRQMIFLHALFPRFVEWGTAITGRTRRDA
jgi:uncharacterized protein